MIGSEDVEPVIRAENFRAGMRDSIASNDFKAIALKMLEYEEYFIKEGQNSEMGKIILQTGLDSIYQHGFYFSLLFFSFLFLLLSFLFIFFLHNLSPGLSRMREFKRGLNVGNKCLARHPISNLWTLAKILRNHDDAITLQIENWPDVVKCGIWFSQIIPSDTFRTGGPSAKDKDIKAIKKLQPTNRKPKKGEEIKREESGYCSTSDEIVRKYMKDIQSLITKCDENFADQEVISGIGKIVEAYKESLHDNHNLQLHAMENIKENEEFNQLTSKALELVKKWKFSITIGKCVDIYHEHDKKWFHAKVKSRKEHTINIHFNGWSKKFDESVDLLDSNKLIYPEHTFTKKRKTVTRVTEGKKKSNGYEYLPVTVNAEGFIEDDTYWNRMGKMVTGHSVETGTKTWISGSGWVDIGELD